MYIKSIFYFNETSRKQSSILLLFKTFFVFRNIKLTYDAAWQPLPVNPVWRYTSFILFFSGRILDMFGIDVLSIMSSSLQCMYVLHFLCHICVRPKSNQRELSEYSHHRTHCRHRAFIHLYHCHHQHVLSYKYMFCFILFNADQFIKFVKRTIVLYALAYWVNSILIVLSLCFIFSTLRLH